MFDFRTHQGPVRWDEKQTDNQMFTDPGHGWYRVQHWMLFLLGDIGISQFSYMDNVHAYLEEDEDYARYLTAVLGSHDAACNFHYTGPDNYHENDMVRKKYDFQFQWSQDRGREQFKVIRGRGFSWDGERLVPPTDFIKVPHILGHYGSGLDVENTMIPKDSRMDCMNIYVPKSSMDMSQLSQEVDFKGLDYLPTSPILEMPFYNDHMSRQLAKRFIPNFESMGWNYATLKYTDRNFRVLAFDTLAKFKSLIKDGTAMFVRGIHHYTEAGILDNVVKHYSFDMGAWPIGARQSTKFSVVRRDIDNNHHESWLDYPKAGMVHIENNSNLLIYEEHGGQRHLILSYELYSLKSIPDAAQ